MADVSSELQQPQCGVLYVTHVEDAPVLIKVVPAEQIVIQRQGSKYICIYIADLH